MNPVILDLGSIKIYWYSIMILLGAIIGYLIVTNESKKYNIPKNYMTNYFFYLIIFSIIGARLYYCTFNFKYYSNNLIEIFQIWNGGLAIHGGLLFGLLWTIFYTKKYNIKTLRFLDIMAPGIIIAQSIGRWGNFFNGEAYGSEVTLDFLQKLHMPQFIINGMNINGIYHHPTFLYESLWCLIGFIIILIIRKRRYIKIGRITSFYLIWYGIGRFFIEDLRTDSLMIFNYKAAQIVSILMIIAGVILFITSKADRFENNYNDISELEDIKF